MPKWSTKRRATPRKVRNGRLVSGGRMLPIRWGTNPEPSSEGLKPPWYLYQIERVFGVLRRLRRTNHQLHAFHRCFIIATRLQPSGGANQRSTERNLDIFC